ncbi:MAG: tetratricopeptide repeat protein [Tissierellia bacterium]|nr:tetratricopeptide repeat protein [Tissierellia bacterium]
MNLDYFFPQAKDQVVFVERKEAKTQEDLGLSPETPLPIMVDDLIDQVRAGQDKTLQGRAVLRGIFYVLGLDQDLSHKANYENLLKTHRQDSQAFLRGLVLEALKEEDLLKSLLFSQAGLRLFEDLDFSKIHIRTMEKIYNREWQKGPEAQPKELKALLEEIITSYEDLLKKDPDLFFANEGLAYIFKAKGQYLKARLYFEKALQGAQEEEDKNQIRDELSLIEDDAYLEAAITYLNYGKFHEALFQLSHISEGYRDRSRVDYGMALAYDKLGQREAAREAFERALDLQASRAAYYNDYAIFLYNGGDLEGALALLSRGLEEVEDKEDLYYNRGILEYQRGQYSQALEDFKSSGKGQESPEVASLIEQLEEGLS